jgi:hypothetical protein
MKTKSIIDYIDAEDIPEYWEIKYASPVINKKMHREQQSAIAPFFPLPINALEFDLSVALYMYSKKHENKGVLDRLRDIKDKFLDIYSSHPDDPDKRRQLQEKHL